MAILVAENEDLKMQIKSLKDKFEILAEEIETARVKNEIRALHAKWKISFFVVILILEFIFFKKR